MQLLFRRRLLSPLRRQHARAAYTSGASGGRGAGGHSSGSSESGGESGREGSVVPPPLRRTLSNVDHNAGNGAGNGSDFQQTKHDMRWLLESIGGQREVSYWLEHYASEEGSDQPFAVIKVGGGVVEDDRQLNDLCSSLAFLKRSGLNPIVIHGAGPQLNADLESQGIVSDYIEGIRVTTPEILRTARRVFLDVNRRLVDALEERGTRARFIDPSLFEADLVDREQYGLVGEINKVQTEWISDATRSGYLPVVCSLAESSLGQTLNVNADVAAVRLAEAVMPMKMIYINTMGGLLDGDDNLIRNINYPSDFEWLLEQPWLRHGTKLKTVEINELLDILPASSSVSVTSPENLMRELFTHKGCGTLCRKETKVHCLDSMETIDLERLKALLKRSFKGRSPVQGYVEGLHKDLHRIYITDDYEGAIILTKEDGIATPYMDKFAVSKLMQGTGTGKALWAQVVADEPKLWWRSRKGNPVNHWYHEIASTLANDIAENWRLYAYGYDLANTADTEELRLCATAARAMPPTIMPPSEDDDSEDDVSDGEEVAQSGGAGGGGGGGGGGSAFASTAAALGPATAAGYSPPPLAPSNTRFFQSSSSCSSSGDKVYNAGLIGARGYVGAELIRLIGDHPSLHLSVASSRALEGQRISEVVEKQRVYGGASSWESAPKGGLDPEARFTNISADDAAAMSDEVDVWFLALPNGKCGMCCFYYVHCMFVRFRL
jgi:acetylglutamate kinase